MTENSRRMIRGCEVEQDLCAKTFGVDCDARLVGFTRTNLLDHSERFEKAVWVTLGSTISEDEVSDPNGINTADAIYETAATSQHRVSQEALTSASTDHNFSLYAKPNGRDFVALSFADSVGIKATTYFDLANGTINSNDVGSAAIESAPNGYYRCSVSASVVAGDLDCYIYISSSGTTSSYAGDITKGIYIWGAQLTEGATLEDYERTFDEDDDGSATVDSLGSSGEKCFNTYATCHAQNDYALDDPVVIRLVEAIGDNPKELNAIPAVSSLNHSTARLRIGQDLGERATASISFDDFIFNDVGVDKYAIERRTGAARADGIGYKPEERSTFFAKWRERNPYFFGRALRTFQGTLEQALADPTNLSEMEVRHYIQESIAGPTSAGRFQIVAKDVLKLADDERAQAPVANNGELSADISAGATSATIVGDETQYSASGYLAIGREIFSFTRSGTTLTFSARGTHFGTPATAHSDGDAIQECLYYNAQKPSFITEDLLTGYASVDASLIDTSAWTIENDNHIAKLYSRLIVKPTSVRKLISELSEQAGFYIWTDETVPEIKFRAIRQPSSAPLVLTPEGYFKEGTVSVSEQPKKRRSQVWLFFNIIDVTDKENDDRNYASRVVTTDSDSESTFAFGRPAIHKIYGGWLPANGKTIAEAVTDRIIARYVNPPRRIVFQLPWDDSQVNIGDFYDIESDLMPDSAGLRTARRIVVLGRERSEDSVLIESEEFNYIPPASAGTNFIDFDADQANVNLRTEHDALYGAADGTTPVVATISANVQIYSTSTGARAFDVGSWPVGQPITIVLEAGAYIAGMGGGGGLGGFNFISPTNGGVGSVGGTGLYTRVAITVENNATIGGGGGGGGGGGAGGGSQSGGTGGGGAGRNIGAGGGSAATLTTGGSGGTTPSTPAGDGGAGGNLGSAGSAGTAGSTSSAGAGGAAGYAIDGYSYITFTTAGTITGPTTG